MNPSSRHRYQRLLHRASFPLVLVLAFWLWLEDWLWEPLARAMQILARLPLVRQIEAGIRRAPPWLALALFGIPVLCLLPFKFAGLWLFARGDYLLGGSVFLLAKLVGTAVVAWIFALTRTSLLQLAWFARLHAGFIAWRQRIFTRIQRTRVWRLVGLLRRRLRRAVRRCQRQP